MFYEIKYEYQGKKGTAIVRPIEGFEKRFSEYCIDRIDSLTRAGAKITETQLHTS